MRKKAGRPKMAVLKFTSCSGCQLSFLNMETELLALAEAVEIACFAMASSAVSAGPYDLTFVEGSISCAEDEERIKRLREQSRILVAVGNCAVYGGPQALRNRLSLGDLVGSVYPRPELVECYPTSRGVAEYVSVDGFLEGCPVDQGHLREYITSVLLGRAPELSTRSVCLECKMKNNVCLIVAEGVACMGVVTSAGCGALCPSYDRGCYGCFGSMNDPNLSAFSNLCRELGLTEDEVHRKYSYVVNNARAFREEADKYAVRPG